MPPAAATSGSMARRQVDSSPRVSSRLISRPATTKNSVISASLVKWWTDQEMPLPAIFSSTDAWKTAL